MKIQQTAIIEYDEVDSNFQLKLPMLFQRFQRAALHHSEIVGLGPQTLMQNSGAWILHWVLVEIYRMPSYQEKLTVQTWNKGAKGVRAERAFSLTCDGETICVAESQWLYFDLERQRIVKIPKEAIDPYTTEKENVLNIGAVDFAVDRRFEPEEVLSLSTREGDYDSNGHVNNTVYLEYLDTLLKRSHFGSGQRNRVAIQFVKEIGRKVHTVQVGASKESASVKFRFFKGSTVYAAGFIETS